MQKNEKEKEHNNRRLGKKNRVRNERENISTEIGRPREQENISAGDWEKKGAREQNMNRKLGRNKVARKQESLSAGDQKTKGAGEHRSSRLREEGNKRTEQEVGIEQGSQGAAEHKRKELGRQGNRRTDTTHRPAHVWTQWLGGRGRGRTSSSRRLSRWRG